MDTPNNNPQYIPALQQPQQVTSQPGLPAQPPVPVQPAPLSPQAPEGRKRKKIIFISLLILVVVIALIGVLAIFAGGSRNTPKTESGTIIWWGFWEDTTVIQPLIDEYQSQNPNITIEYVPQPRDEYRERLANAMARGRGPDIFRMHDTWVPMFRRDLAILPSNLISAEDYEATFYPAAVESLTTSEGIVGIPLQYDGIGLFVNTDILTTFGKLEPKSWNEFRESARELTIGSGEGITQGGAALGNTVNVDHWEEILAMLLVQNSASLSDPSSERSVEAVEYFRQFSGSENTWNTILPPSTVAFSTGRLAMMFGNSQMAYEVKSRNPGLDFKVIPVPQLTKFTGEEPDVTYSSYWTEAVWEKSANKAVAWNFLAFLTTPESLQKLHRAQELSATVFPEPYPRRDMNQLLVNDPTVGGIMKLAEEGRTWYMASNTGDGATGINSELSSHYSTALSAPQFSKQIQVLADNVRATLAKYGLR